MYIKAMSDQGNSKLLSLLDEQYTWPDYFHFKFILKDKDNYVHFEEEFGTESISIRHSKTGKYQSLTCRKLISDSAQVLAVYQRLSKIEGVITL